MEARIFAIETLFHCKPQITIFILALSRKMFFQVPKQENVAGSQVWRVWWVDYLVELLTKGSLCNSGFVNWYIFMKQEDTTNQY